MVNIKNSLEQDNQDYYKKAFLSLGQRIEILNEIKKNPHFSQGINHFKQSIFEDAADIYAQLGDISTACELLERSIKIMDPIRDKFFIDRNTTIIEEITQNTDKLSSENLLLGFYVFLSTGICLYSDGDLPEPDISFGFLSANLSFWKNTENRDVHYMNVGCQNKCFLKIPISQREESLFLMGEFPALCSHKTMRKVLEEKAATIISKVPKLFLSIKERIPINRKELDQKIKEVN